MASKALPCPTLLRQLLRYEPDTGKLFWRARPLYMFKTAQHWKTWNVRFCGKVAGADCGKGYLLVRIFTKNYKAHRVCWAMHYGFWPENQIDHINCTRSDNRINNLRAATNIENQQNKKHTSNNSGVVGVCWIKADKKWRAHIKVRNKLLYLGQFSDLAEAINARRSAELKHGYFCARPVRLRTG